MRYGLYTQNDTAATQDGDKGWTGVNTKLDRWLLPPQILANSVNKRLVRGVAETRPGIVTPSAYTTAAGPYFGSGIYSDPNGIEWLLLATAAGIYRARWDRPADLIALPAGVTLTGPVDLVQCFNQVLLFRGETLAPLQWDGQLTSAFVAIELSSDGTGIITIPAADTAVIFADRLMVPYNRDHLAFSDVLDYTRYDSILNDFRINAGTSESIVRVFPYTQTTVLVFKEHSIHMLSNVYGTLSDNARQDQVTRELGCYARRTVVTVGADVFFLASTGVYRILQLLNQVQTAPVPISDVIQPWIDRINWTAATQAVAIVFERYYYLAVPIDSSTVNNALLIYNTATEQWEGYDTATAWALAIDHLLVTEWLGSRRLFAIDNANGRVLLLGEGTSDLIGGVEYPVQDLMETRGYTLGEPGDIKGFRRLGIALATWNPTLQIAIATEGRQSNELLTTLTRNRLQYFNWGQADYNPTNANNDQLADGRQDYAVICPAAGVSCGSDGLILDAEQESLDRQTLRATGRWLSVKITGTQGRCNIRTINVEGAETERSTREQT